MANFIFKSVLLSILTISISSGIYASDESSYSIQNIFRLRFIFDDQNGENSEDQVKTSVVLLGKPEEKQDPIELINDEHNSIFPGDENYNKSQYKLPDNTLTFCFIIVTFYMLYFSLRMFMKPEVETTETVIDHQVLQQLLIDHQFAEAVIPDKLRSLYDDSDPGETNLTKINLIIDHVQLPDPALDDTMDKPPGYQDIVEMLDAATLPCENNAVDAPPPYSEVTAGDVNILEVGVHNGEGGMDYSREK